MGGQTISISSHSYPLFHDCHYSTGGKEGSEEGKGESEKEGGEKGRGRNMGKEEEDRRGKWYTKKVKQVDGNTRRRR